MGYRLLHVDVSCDQPLEFSADACLIACNTVPTSGVESVRSKDFGRVWLIKQTTRMASFPVVYNCLR